MIKLTGTKMEKVTRIAILVEEVVIVAVAEAIIKVKTQVEEVGTITLVEVALTMASPISSIMAMEEVVLA